MQDVTQLFQVTIENCLFLFFYRRCEMKNYCYIETIGFYARYSNKSSLVLKIRKVRSLHNISRNSDEFERRKYKIILVDTVSPSSVEIQLL